MSKVSRYEPPTNHDLAEHYGVAMLPARARAKDKTNAKVENGVLGVPR